MALYELVAAGYTNGSVSEVTTRDGFNLEKASGPDRFLGQFNAFGAWQYNTPSDSRAEHKIALSATVSSGNSIRVYFNVSSSGGGLHVFQITDAGAWTLGQADDFTFIDTTYASGTGVSITGNGTTYNLIEVDGSDASQVNVWVNGVQVVTDEPLDNTFSSNLYGGFLLGSGGEAEYFQIGEAGGGGDGTATPATVALSVSTPSATVTGGAVATPAAVTRTVSTPAPTVTGGAVASPAAVARTVTTPAPTVTGGAVATPAAVALTVSTPAPSVGADGTATPTAVALTATTPTPTVTGGAVASPAAVALLVATPTPTAIGGAVATPAAVEYTVVTPSATVTGGALATPTAVALLVTVPTPTTTGGAVATPAAVALAVVCPVPFFGVIVIVLGDIIRGRDPGIIHGQDPTVIRGRDPQDVGGSPLMMYRYRKGVTLGPAIVLDWRDRNGDLRDFSTNWTFSAKVCLDGTNVGLRTKTSGITGAATSPNVTIDWETADHADLTADRKYKVILTATPSSGDPIEFPNAIVFALDAALT